MILSVAGLKRVFLNFRRCFQWVGVVVALDIYGSLPFRFRGMLGRIIGFCFISLNRAARNRTENHLRRGFPNVPQVKIAQLARAVFVGLGQTIFECLDLRPILRRGGSRFTLNNSDLQEETLREGRPILALSAHTGNWELLAAYFASQGTPMTVLGLAEETPTLSQSLLDEGRRRLGISTIWLPAKGALDVRSTKRLLQSFKSNHVLAALIDLKRSGRSRNGQFFGGPVETPAGLIEIAKRANAIIILAFIIREVPGYFRIYLHRIGEEASTADIVREYNQKLEDCIRDWPDQWVWFHNRWSDGDVSKQKTSQAV